MLWQNRTEVLCYEKIKIIPKKRYAFMTEYLPKKAALPYVMMRETAGIQVGIDFESEEDAMAKLYTANVLSPFMTAIFANSPGCRDTPPKLNQLLAPCIAFVNSTSIKRIIDIIYNGSEIFTSIL